MDFRELIYVTKVADCGSISEAARQLYISQPSLSSSISKIEQDLGMPIFDRRFHPLKLTYAGEKYVETARQILKLNSNLKKELIDIDMGEKGRIRFGIPTERTGYMLPRVIPEYQKLFPKVDIEIYEASGDDLLASLLKDEINFYIIPRDLKDLPGGLKGEFIYKEQIYLVAPPGAVTEDDMIRDGCHRHVDPRFLEKHPLIVLKKGHAQRKKVNSILRRYGLDARIGMEVSSCISAVQLADSGLGITLVPRRAVDALGGPERFCCYDIGDATESWDVNVIYKKDIYLDRLERAFIDMIKAAFQN